MSGLFSLFKDPGIATKMKNSVGLSMVLKLEEEEDTNLVITRSNRGITVPPNSPAPTKYFLYLFYKHYGSLKRCHTLYKVEIDMEKKLKIKAPSQILLEFPHGVGGMKGALLGSKLYFLGGSILSEECDPISNRDVYVYDILTNEFEKMDARLNAGKPNTCEVFAVNGKVYAIPTIPYLPMHSGAEWSTFSDELLFECFDPSIGTWQVLDLPSVKEGCFVSWIGSTVLLERQQVVVFGLEGSGFVGFIYHFNEDKWTRQISMKLGSTLPFQEGGQEGYFYGVSLHGPPLKSKLPYLSYKDEMKLYGCKPVDGVIQLSIPGKPMLEEGCWAEWMDTYFGKPYVDDNTSHRLLRYLGNNHFCYVVSGMLPGPHYRVFPDPFIRGIIVTLFKELPPAREEHFQVDVLSSKRFEISEIQIPGTQHNTAELVGCYLYTPEDQLQQIGDKKKKKKKKSKKKNNNFSDP